MSTSGAYDTFDAAPPLRREVVLGAGGVRLNVEIHGREDRPTIVLTHGWTCSIAFWSRQLRDLGADFRVVAFDQRGHGASEAPGPDGFTIEALADDLAAVLEATVPPGQKVVLAGHSMGAMSMVAFAHRHADRLHRQVAAGLFASTGVEELIVRSAIVPMPMPLATLMAPVSSKIIGVSMPGKRINGGMLTLIKYASMSGSATRAEVDFATRIVQACPPRTRSRFATMLAGLRIAGQVREFDVPAVVVAGERDRLTPVWHARSMAAELPRLQTLVEVPGAGHMTPIQAWTAVDDAIRGLARSYLPGTVDLTGTDAVQDAVRGIA